MRTPTRILLGLAVATAVLLPAAPASSSGIGPIPTASDGGGSATISLAITPPHVDLASTNESAAYSVRVTSNATFVLTVDLDVTFVTPNWSIALGSTTLLVPAGGNASTSATFSPPSNAAPGAEGRFDLRASGQPSNVTATDSATARVVGGSAITLHRIYGTSGTTDVSIAPRCSLVVSPPPGFACGAPPLAGEFRCDASGALAAAGALSRVSIHFPSASRVTTFHGNAFTVSGNVPDDAYRYTIQLVGPFTVTDVRCAFAR